MTSLSYYLPYRKFKSCSKGFHMGYSNMLDKMAVSNTASIISSATRCLSIGPDSGECEIDLIKKLMPKLQTLTAIEPDVASAVDLRKNLQQLLPNVASHVYESKFQQVFDGIFRADEQPPQYDVILMLRCLYHFPAEDRRALFGTLQNQLLKPGGVAIILHSSRCDTSGGVMQICSYLEKRDEAVIVSAEMVQSEMENAGFKLICMDEYTYDLDFSNVDQDLADYFTIWLEVTITVQQLNEAVRKACPDGVSQKTYNRMMWFQK